MHTVITHVEQKLAELANRTEEELEEELEKQEKSVELAARVCANLHEWGMNYKGLYKEKYPISVFMILNPTMKYPNNTDYLSFIPYALT